LIIEINNNKKKDEKDELENKKKKKFIFDQIKECTNELFSCLHAEPTVFQPLRNAFELYGFDFLVDEKLNCLFLEANAFPDFKQTGDNLDGLIDCLFYQTIALTVDKFFQQTPVCDTDKMHLVYAKESVI
jgi:tubulin---tyrosine ligase